MPVENGGEANFLGAVVERTDVGRLEMTILLGERKKSALSTEVCSVLSEETPIKRLSKREDGCIL